MVNKSARQSSLSLKTVVPSKKSIFSSKSLISQNTKKECISLYRLTYLRYLVSETGNYYKPNCEYCSNMLPLQLNTTIRTNSIREVKVLKNEHKKSP